MAPADRRFVGQNLLKGRCGLDVNKWVAGGAAARWEYGAVCRALANCDITMLTAGESPRPVGFKVTENVGGIHVLHWVYVEPLYRRQGAASSLANGYVAHSALNASGRRLGALNGQYTPYLWLRSREDWKLADSSAYHHKQFLDWAENLATI
jgi:GNAT superfamily N-acetyltransferase